MLATPVNRSAVNPIPSLVPLVTCRVNVCELADGAVHIVSDTRLAVVMVCCGVYVKPPPLGVSDTPALPDIAYTTRVSPTSAVTEVDRGGDAE
jgi:hypothetical protein